MSETLNYQNLKFVIVFTQEEKCLLSPFLWESNSLNTSLENLHLEVWESIALTAKEITPTAVITMMATSHKSDFHSSQPTSQVRVKDLYFHRKNKWERCISVSLGSVRHPQKKSYTLLCFHYCLYIFIYIKVINFYKQDSWAAKQTITYIFFITLLSTDPGKIEL